MSNTPSFPDASSGNFLKDLIPASQRKRVYALYGLFATLVTITALAVAAVTGGIPPTWIIVLTIVSNGLAPLFSGLAASNVTTPNEAEPPVAPEDPYL